MLACTRCAFPSKAAAPQFVFTHAVVTLPRDNILLIEYISTLIQEFDTLPIFIV